MSNPDVSFTRAERAPERGTKAWAKPWPVAPDLAAEIASPSQGPKAMTTKALDWMESGTRLLWVIWPDERRVDVWLPGQQHPTEQLGMADMLDGREVLPGFRYPVARLFR